jgi:hypothetical protein
VKPLFKIRIRGKTGLSKTTRRKIEAILEEQLQTPLLIASVKAQSGWLLKGRTVRVSARPRKP